MIHPDTVLMLTLKGSLFLAYTICYVNGKVGCSRKYKSHYNCECRGRECYADFHHISNQRMHHGFCFVEHGINVLISAIVSPSAPSGCKIRRGYDAFPPARCLENLWNLKDYEENLALELVDDALECDRDQETCPSQQLLVSLLPGYDNSDFLERADASHKKLAGVSRGTGLYYQFAADRLPEFVHGCCVMEEFISSANRKLRVIHGRCPILGIGGTRVEGHNTWPVVCHHIEYVDPDAPLSLSSFCHHCVNMGIDCLPT